MTKSKGGRPPAELPPNAEALVSGAAFAGSPDKEIAALLGVSVSTVKVRFQAVLTKQRAARKLQIRTWQMSAAKKGNPALLIWLGKQAAENGGLGQVEAYVVQEPNWRDMSDDELARIAEGKAKPVLKLVRGKGAAADAADDGASAASG